MYNVDITLFFIYHINLYLQYLLMKITSSELSLYHTIYMIGMAAAKNRNSTITQ